jgi:DNA-binding response OmpR family regulator
MPTVLIVDDEANIIELSRLYFEKEGWRVITAQNGEVALKQVKEQHPDVMLLDIMLPKVDGWDVCRKLRAEGNTIPIIVLTARSDDIDKIIGLELGADDYVTKPFNPREVVARAKGLLRRQGWDVEKATGTSGGERLTAATLMIDVAAHSASSNGKTLSLRPREWELLVMFVRRQGEALSRDQLLDQVWGFEYYGDTRTVDVHVAALREKLREVGESGVTIETVWGIGYKMVVES